MHEVFADSAALTADFAQTLAYWAVVVVMGVAVLWVADRGRPASLTVGASIAFGAVLLAIISFAVYSNTVANFAAITVRGNTVHLAYPAPFARTVTISSEDVGQVLLGLPGKGNSPMAPCYIKLVLRSGGNHRSASRGQTVEACKQLRLSIERALVKRQDGT